MFHPLFVADLLLALRRHLHDDVNRLTADDQFTYTYDANGNLETKTSIATPTDVTTYHWDFQDQLTQIDFPDATSTTYKYDGLGRRIEKNVNGTITRYIYDGEDIVLEYDGTNTFVARYSHGDQTDQPLAVQRAGLGFFYYQSDHQGSITHLTDSSGNIANSYLYDSYGRPTNIFESVIQPFTYTGREFDTESGLYYYRARFYNPHTGRFLSEDPIEFLGRDQNLYRYVSNNPINLSDPTGLVTFTLGGSFRAPFGAGGIGGGIAISFPDPITGGQFDLGFFGTISGGGEGGGLGRGTVDVGIHRGSVTDLAGRGIQLSATAPFINRGAFLNFDGCENITGGGLRFGYGLNAEGQATFTGTLSTQGLNFGNGLQ